MTVGELIAKLQEHDPALPVALLRGGLVVAVSPDRSLGETEPEDCVVLASQDDLDWLVVDYD